MADFDENLHGNTYCPSRHKKGSKIQFKKIQDGGPLPFSKPLNAISHLYNYLTDFNKMLNTITYYFA